MTGRAFVVVGPKVRLDRGGLSAPAPQTVEGLLALCHQWAAEVGWSLAMSPGEADALILGPGVAAPPVDIPVATVLRGQGIDGFRWALRHVAFTKQWPAKTVTYGPGPDHVADVRRPESPGPHRVAVLLHGGFWMDAWRRDLMDGLALDLSRRGWVTVNAEYRRVGAGGGWPATGRDVLAVIDGTERIPNVHPDGLLLVGHSAGAQLALWAAGERRDRIAHVVSLAGLCDLDAAKRHGLGGGAVQRLLEGEPTEVASPLQRLPLGVPVTVAHAAHDGVVPADQSRRYVDAAQAAGDAVEYIEVDSGDHMALIDPAGPWTTVAQRLPPP